MKKLYALNVACISLLLALNLCPSKTQDTPILSISNPIKLHKLIEWQSDFQRYRGHAIIKADSLGITAEECLALMSGHASDEECEYYSFKYSQLGLKNGKN